MLFEFIKKNSINTITTDKAIIIPATERDKFKLADLQAVLPVELQAFESHSKEVKAMVSAIQLNPMLKPEGWVEPVQSVMITSATAKVQDDTKLKAKYEQLMNKSSS